MRDWELRMAVGRRLISWGIISPLTDEHYGFGDGNDPVYQHLAWLLDYEDGEHFMFGFREADRVKLEWLLSPYGLTVYRMMVLRKNVADCNV